MEENREESGEEGREEGRKWGKKEKRIAAEMRTKPDTRINGDKYKVYIYYIWISVDIRIYLNTYLYNILIIVHSSG